MKYITHKVSIKKLCWSVLVLATPLLGGWNSNFGGLLRSGTNLAACSTSPRVYYANGGTQTFEVPAGCTKITVYAWGAGGGSGRAFVDTSTFNGGAGGSGAGVQATFPVTAGNQFNVYVGRGGPGGGGSPTWEPTSGGGGGFTGLILSPSMVVYLVAGSGGGGGSRADNSCTTAAGRGGGGGDFTKGLDAQKGGVTTSACGKGGTNPSSGGAAGTGTNAGTPGGANYGGNGGGDSSSGVPLAAATGGGNAKAGPCGGGGGGGAGYQGGGGGAAGGSGGVGGSGGGGGSSFVHASGTSVSVDAGETGTGLPDSGKLPGFSSSPFITTYQPSTGVGGRETNGSSNIGGDGLMVIVPAP